MDGSDGKNRRQGFGVQRRETDHTTWGNGESRLDLTAFGAFFLTTCKVSKRMPMAQTCCMSNHQSTSSTIGLRHSPGPHPCWTAAKTPKSPKSLWRRLARDASLSLSCHSSSRLDSSNAKITSLPPLPRGGAIDICRSTATTSLARRCGVIVNVKCIFLNVK